MRFGPNCALAIGMSVDKSELRERVRLAVHRRYTMDPQGHVRDEAFVQCPVSEESLALDECGQCTHCAARLSGAQGPIMIDCVPRATSTKPGSNASPPASNDPVGAASRTRALDLTDRNTLCVRADADLTHIASVVLRLGVARATVVVVDADLHPLGTVAHADIDRAERVAGRPHRPTAGDAMHAVRVALPTDVTVSLAAAAIAETGSDDVPLVNDDGKVVAVIRATDIVRWFASLEGYVLSTAVYTIDQPCE